MFLENFSKLFGSLEDSRTRLLVLWFLVVFVMIGRPELYLYL